MNFAYFQTRTLPYSLAKILLILIGWYKLVGTTTSLTYIFISLMMEWIQNSEKQNSERYKTEDETKQRKIPNIL